MWSVIRLRRRRRRRYKEEEEGFKRDFSRPICHQVKLRLRARTYLLSDYFLWQSLLPELEGFPLSDVEPVGEDDVQGEGGEQTQGGHHGHALAKTLATVEIGVFLIKEGENLAFRNRIQRPKIGNCVLPALMLPPSTCVPSASVVRGLP